MCILFFFGYNNITTSAATAITATQHNDMNDIEDNDDDPFDDGSFDNDESSSSSSSDDSELFWLLDTDLGFALDSETALFMEFEDDEEEQKMKMIKSIVLCGAYLCKRAKVSYSVRERIQWNNHVQQLMAEGPDVFPVCIG